MSVGTTCTASMRKPTPKAAPKGRKSLKDQEKASRKYDHDTHQLTQIDFKPLIIDNDN